MQTRDGVRLDADVYVPDANGPFPVLLMRQPYGRAIASTVVYAHPTWYAAHGYLVVIQDVRGRGTSEGNFYPFATEVEDGYDAVQWAAALPESTGQVGMYGFSYQGLTQLYAAIAHPPALRTICPAMMGYDLCREMAYENGGFYWQATMAWAIQLEAESARLRGDQDAYRALLQASRQLPLTDPIPTRPQVLQDYAPHSFYFDWLDHPDPNSDYWRHLSPKDALKTIDLPMLHIGGWFDIYLRGNLNLYRAMVDQSHQPQHLIIGPWVHLPWSRKVGAIDYGSQAANPVDRLQIRWFDQFLKGQNTGLLQEQPVRLFDLGQHQWRSFPTWPSRDLKSFFLNSTGLASLSGTEGTLSHSLPDAPVTDTLVHDPWRPAPAFGGHAAIPSGPLDRSSLDNRSDILTYTTPPLTQALSLVGEPWLELDCSADQPSFDLCAVLSEVHPSGAVYNFTQGYIRLEPGQTTHPVRFSLQPTCIRIAQNHQLRLSLSAACFPTHPVNSGSGATAGETRLMDARIISVTIRCGGKPGSRLLLPIG